MEAYHLEMNPDYDFLLNNLSILVTDVDFRNITKHYPELAKVSLMQRQKIINLKRQVLRDIESKPHNLILFTNTDWQMITDYYKQAKESAEV